MDPMVRFATSVYERIDAQASVMLSVGPTYTKRYFGNASWSRMRAWSSSSGPTVWGRPG